MRLTLSTVVIAALIAATAPGAELEVVKTSYGNMVLSGYVIGRYTYQPGENAAGFSTATSAFTLRSASVIMAGDVFKYAGYLLYVDAAASPAIIDAYGALKAIPHVEIRMGQFLVPYSRESYTSSSKILFVDRALVVTNTTQPLGRDVGAQAELALKPEGKPHRLTFAAGGFNGPGLGHAEDNAPKDLALRLAGNPLPWAATAGLTAEAYYYLGKPNVFDPAAPSSRWGIGDETRLGGCLAFDHPRFTFQSEYLSREIDLAGDANHTAYNSNRDGFYAAASYKQPLPWPWLQQLEPCARWEQYDPGQAVAGDKTTGVTGGLNLHFDPGHHAKLMLNYQTLAEETTAVDNDKVSAQFQVRF